MGPLLPLVLLAALAAVALSKKSPSTETAPTGGGAASPGGIPSYPVAAGALNSAANAASGGTSSSAAASPGAVSASGSVSVPLAPPPAVDSGGAPVVPVIPVTIVGSSGATGQTAPWDPATMTAPSWQALPAIPQNFRPQSQETIDVQTALNNWANAVGFQGTSKEGGALIPLATDGDFGSDTQMATAAFQSWANGVKNAGLTQDGLPGPDTQTYLLDWGSISSGGY